MTFIGTRVIILRSVFATFYLDCQAWFIPFKNYLSREKQVQYGWMFKKDVAASIHRNCIWFFLIVEQTKCIAWKKKENPQKESIVCC